jgi:hypothetical protein
MLSFRVRSLCALPGQGRRRGIEVAMCVRPPRNVPAYAS